MKLSQICDKMKIKNKIVTRFTKKNNFENKRQSSRWQVLFRMVTFSKHGREM